jgi:hypothetical protein
MAGAINQQKFLLLPPSNGRFFYFINTFDLTTKTPQRQAIRRISGVSGTLDAE